MLFVPGGAHEKMDHGFTRETISGAFIKHLRYGGGKCKGGNARRGILFVLLSRGILLLLTACVIPGT